MTRVISKKISGKRYWYYDKYYTKEEALLKALELKKKGKMEKYKVRTYIEEVKEYGELAELFIPNTKYYLWTNGD